MTPPASPRPAYALIAAGLLVWAIAGAPLLSPADLTPVLIAWLAFPVPFIVVTVTRGPVPLHLALLGVQALAAVTMGSLSHGLPAATLAVVAGQLPFRLTSRPAAAWLLAQTAAFTTATFAQLGPGDATVFCAAFAAFQLFAFGSARLAVREARASAELLAAQGLLEQQGRELERQRVSRELHDVLGHHLTALSLQLEVARHVVHGQGKEPVEKALALSHQVLAQVREVVSSLREPSPLDLAAALEQAIAAVPGLRVHMDCAGLDRVDAPRAAQALLRCVQEAVTNAARHGGARNLWLSVKAEGPLIHVAVRDDGRGAETVVPGNGLKGLSERLAELGGELAVETRSGQGFSLEARIPLGAAR